MIDKTTNNDKSYCGPMLGSTMLMSARNDKEVSMAQTSDKKSKRGLASASKKTRQEVARMGGSAYHEKRGQKGSDSRRAAAM